MHRELEPRKEYLVASGLSDEEVIRKLEELFSIRILLRSSTRCVMTEFERMISVKNSFSQSEHYITLFETGAEYNVIASVYPQSSGDWNGRATLQIGTIAASDKFNARKAEIGFIDHTIEALENWIPALTIRDALAAIDRWIELLSHPIGQGPSAEPPACAAHCARNFVGSVAMVAEQQGTLERIISKLEIDAEWEDPTASVEFPTKQSLPRVIFSDLSEDWGRDYNCLSDDAAAIFSLALPYIISASKSYSADRSNDYSQEPFALNFAPWRSFGHLFTPSSSMSSVLGTLPRMPKNAVML